MSLALEFGEYLDAQAHGFWITSPEELRVRGELKRAVVDQRERTLLTWSPVSGLSDHNGNEYPVVMEQKGTGNRMMMAMQVAISLPRSSKPVLVLCDPHPYLLDKDTPELTRQVRELSSYKRLATVCISPGADMPMELRHCTIPLDLTLPSVDELTDIAKGVRGIPGKGAIQVAEAARAMTGFEAEILMRRAVLRHGFVVDAIAHDIWNAKAAVLQTKGVTIERPNKKFEAVGGAYHIKQWFKENAWAFSAAGRARGLSPRGLLIAGPPGTGKTLIAMCVAAELGWNFTSINVAEFFNLYQGETERFAREAFHVLKALSPVVAFFDEARHQFRGHESSGVTDSGTTARVIGDVMKFMNDRTEPIFSLFATNEPWDMPPQMLRTGRIDATMGLGIPKQDAVEDILQIALNDYFPEGGHTLSRKEVRPLCVAMKEQRFTGSDVTQVVINVVRRVGDRAPTITDLERAMRALVPYSKVKPEHVDQIEVWCKTHAICEAESGNQ